MHLTFATKEPQNMSWGVGCEVNVSTSESNPLPASLVKSAELGHNVLGNSGVTS